MDTSLQNIYTYCEAHTFGPTELLSEVERTTHLKTLAPRMLSGHLRNRDIYWIFCIESL